MSLDGFIAGPDEGVDNPLTHQSSWPAFDHAAVSTWMGGLTEVASGLGVVVGILSTGSVTSWSCPVADLPATPLPTRVAITLLVTERTSAWSST
jgi:hypothetical protein